MKKINIPQDNTHSTIEKQETVQNELFSELSYESPVLDTNLDIHIPIEGGHKQEKLSSCGFGVLQNRLQHIDINMTEREIQNIFLTKTPDFFRNIKKGYRNIFGTDPGTIQKGLNILLDIYKKPFVCRKKNGLGLEEIIDILKTGQPIMVQYTMQQDYIFQILKNKSEIFEKHFGDKSKYFTYGYPHYGLLIGINGKENMVDILDPIIGTIEKLPFPIRRAQFCLKRPHQSLLFHGARKLGFMKPQTGIYFQENNGEV